MSEKYDLRRELKWSGKFWFSNDPNKSFTGELSYSPTVGVRLLTLRIETVLSIKKPENNSIIHDNAEEIGRVTLLGCLRLKHNFGSPKNDIPFSSCNRALAYCNARP
jgi:hypothetical protein